MNDTAKKFKVARITTTPNAFVHIIKTIIELRKDNFNFHFISSDEPYAKYLHDTYGFEQIPTSIRREISPLHDLLSVVNLIRIFRMQKYDIVHSSTPKGGLVTALAGFLTRVPVRIHTFTGQRWAVMTGPKRKLLMFLDKLVINLNTRCYADSKSQVQFLVDSGVAKPGQVFCLGEGSYGGVDLDHFSRSNYTDARPLISQKYKIPSDKPWILFVGRITRDKGINELITAFVDIHQIQPAELILVGDMESIDDKSREAISLNEHIHYVGFQNDPASFMAASDLLCIPSFREGFGTVVIEAAALGLPSIGTDIPGLKDSIQNDHTGLLVPLNDLSSLKKALLKLLTDKNYRLQLGEGALKRAREVYSSDRVAKLLKNEYLELLHRAKKF